MFTSILLSPILSAHIFYSCSADDSSLREYSLSGVTMRTIPMVMPGETIQSCGTGTVDYLGSGHLFLVVQLASQPVGQHSLIRADTYTGNCELVTHLGDAFGGLATSSTGVLWAITADTAMTPGALYSIDTVTGSFTFQANLGADGPGEALAFHEFENRIYRASGDAMQTYEAIDPVTLTRTPMLLSNPWGGTPAALYFDDEAAGGAFHLATDTVFGTEYRFIQGTMTSPGPAISAGTFDHVLAGILGLFCLNCADCDLDTTPGTILDSLKAAQITLSLVFPRAWESWCCDVDQNLDVNVIDALMIAQAAAGLPVSLSCGAP